MSAGTPVQLPPYFRETRPTSVRAEALPYHVADPELPKHWQHTGAGDGIIVGICDTGVDYDHVEISGRVHAIKSFVGDSAFDGNGHGTHVASTIVGRSVGVAPRAKVAIAKVLEDNGSGSSEDVAHGVDWLVDAGCHIINLSLGGPQDDPFTRAAIERALAAGVIVIAATGNERANRVGYPARHCVAVGAVDRKLRLADFSNKGKDVDLVGYGVEVLAALPGNKYAAWSGTSMATPFIAGIAANRLSAEKKHLGRIVTRKPADILKLQSFVRDLGPAGFDTSYGRGFPDLTRCFYEQLDALKPVDPNDGDIWFGRIEHPASGVAFAGPLRRVTAEAE
jgi:major intracellular serine protease